MELTFLGTGSAFGYPQPFCVCEDCETARKLGGKNIRKRSAALINSDLLIDLGPDLLSSAHMHGVNLTEIQHCLLTHAHPDHLHISHLISRLIDVKRPEANKLHLYASAATLALADEMLKKEVPEYSLTDPKALGELNIELHEVEAFKAIQVGPYEVIPFPAIHAPDLQAMLYAVKSEEGCIFYGTDTEALSEEVWQAFDQHNLKFDLVVFDHTNGTNPPGFGHLNADRVTDYTKRLHQEELLKENGQVYITHIAHRGNPPHDELVEFARENGYQVAFDGLKITI